MNDQDLFENDLAKTLTNRGNLLKNKNLLYWYKNLYKTQFSGIGGFPGKVVLEIGSGTSPLKHFHSHVITSDIMGLGYLDHSFDCHQIDRYMPIPDGTVDIVTMTNVLHHLQDPITCLKKIAAKLKIGGSVVIAEPYFSSLSKVIYKHLHHEQSKFDIDKPALDDVRGPLSSSNMAIPYMIFFSEKGWDKELADIYDFSKNDAIYFSALSYMATGGISKRIPIPHLLYKIFFGFDMFLARVFPKLFGSFFIIRLIKKR